MPGASVAHRTRQQRSRRGRALRARRRIALGISILLVFAGAAVQSAPVASADPCDGSTNPIVCENSRPGSPRSEWEVSAGGDQSVAGFATEMSVDAGATVEFKITTAAPAYVVEIYRLGWYGGSGARHLGTATLTTPPTVQPPCLNDPATGLIDCGNWSVSASWSVPGDAVSGVYVARAERTDTGGANHIPFIVRNDGRQSDIVLQTADTTWQAYNDWGGNSLYTGAPVGRAYKVSYNRPFRTRVGTPAGRDFLFSAEYPMLRWLERNGYDVSYLSGIDSDRLGAELLNHDVFMSVGHDEYWSAQQRSNVEAARDAGVNLAFFSGNEVYWKTRWEPSIDGSGTPHRTLVSYKETRSNAKIDPDPSWTGTWRDPRFSPPSDGGRPENELTGTLFTVNCCSYPMEVPAEDGAMRFWRGTDIASLAPGERAVLPDGTLGYEWDEDVDNGHRPPGLMRLSTTTVDVPQKLIDFGTNVAPGTATHHLTMHRAASGALVFGAGTVQWSWGLDDMHDGVAAPPDERMQQATVNLLADMRVQPLTLQSGLSATSASTDGAGPTVVVTSPASGASLANGTHLTVTGTATDAGGGRVAGVEVSLDGGTTWHPATGRESWSYTGTLGGLGPVAILARAVDDSANLGTEVQVPVDVTCPCTMFGAADGPTTPDKNDTNEVEVGVKFKTTVDGFITGIRFFKETANVGTHTGTLWSANGTELATATFTTESSTGWQQVDFAQAVPVTAGTTYVASYHSPNGHYASTDDYFYLGGSPNPPVQALSKAEAGSNGVFAYGSRRFPTSSFGAPNYWVDAVFQTVEPPDVTSPVVLNRSPLPGSSSVSLATAPSATFNEPVDPSSIEMTLTPPTGPPVSGAVGYDEAQRRATFTPDSPLLYGTTYTVTISAASDPSGNELAQPDSWTFTTATEPRPPGQCPCSLWDDTVVPAVPSTTDTKAVELGVRFTAEADGHITGVRFYKGPGNQGTHTGSVWSLDGTRLAQATFTSETTSGWQQVDFSTPVPVTAGVTYLASYHAPVGRYAATSAYFSGKGVDKPPLHAPPDAVGARNGIYSYGPSSFPVNGNGSNYWVDVVFVPLPDTTPPVVVSTTPSQGATSVAISSTVRAAFNEDIVPDSASLAVSGPDGEVLGSVSYDAATRSAVLTPSSALSASTTYRATVNGAVDVAGNTMAAPVSWDFTTAGVEACPCSIWSADAVPTVPAASEARRIEVGVKFRTDAPGWITGVRFYKGPGNTGVHTGSLWSTTGVLLSRVTFENETASGWQEALFANPVAVTAGTTYVVSYHAPVGRYASDLDYFTSSGVDNSPMHALASGVDGPNGVYKYGASGFPTSTFRSANYWVDAVFTPNAPVDVTAPTVARTDPPDGATSVPPGAVITATFDEAVDPATIDFQVRDDVGNAIPGSTTYDSLSRTARFTPTSPLPSATGLSPSVSAADSFGNVMPAPTTWRFVTALPTPPAGVCPCSLWPDSAVPATRASNDSQAVEIGLKFRAATDGFVTGVRFYKGVGNDGPHTGSLWTSTGQLLATGSFVGESTAGWQQLAFADPVAVTAGTTYVASYHAPVGRYAATQGAFGSSGVVNGPLEALASGVEGPNGVYRYGSSGFPTLGTSTNYWVDVVFDDAPAADGPVISDLAVAAGGDSATVTWTTDVPADSTVRFGTSPDDLSSAAAQPGLVTSHSVTVGPLAPNSRYWFRAESTDAQGLTARSPSPPAPPIEYAPAAVPFVHDTAAELRTGTATDVVVMDNGGASVALAPVVGADFAGTGLPSGWEAIVRTRGAATVAGGLLSVDAADVRTTALFGPGRSLGGLARFSPASGQVVGLGTTLADGTSRAVFMIGNDGVLRARTTAPPTRSRTTLLPGVDASAWHWFRIDWGPASVDYWLDGVLVASHAISPTEPMRPVIRDTAAGAAVQVDWLFLGPVASSGSLTSTVLDAGSPVDWGAVDVTASVPPGSALTVRVRTGDSPVPDASWNGWTPIAPGDPVGRRSRYIQYQLELSGGGAVTPSVSAVTLAYAVP